MSGARVQPRSLARRTRSTGRPPSAATRSATFCASMGDAAAQQRAVEDFLLASRRPCAEIDLALGRSGSLLVAAMLLPIGGDVRAFGEETMRAIWRKLDTDPVIAASPGAALGMAHGWTGCLYAALRWCIASGDDLPPTLVQRLHEFAALAVPTGPG